MPIILPYSSNSYNDVFHSSVVSCSEVPPIGESSGKAIIYYTSPHVGEYKLQNQILKLPNIPSIRDMGCPTNYVKSKEPCLKPISFIKEGNIMSTIVKSVEEPHPSFSSCVPSKNISKFAFSSQYFDEIRGWKG